MLENRDTDDRISKAEREIANILARLEGMTGSNVDELGIEAIDVTKMQDERQRLMCHVRIVLRRAPGHDWAI